MLKAEIGNTTVYYTRGFELISRREKTIASYYVYDGGLSVRALTNESGTVTDTLVFDAFGNETGRTGTTDNPYGFQGEEQDATDLYYLRARYMDPATGTFTTMDTYGGSLSDPMSLHKYLFANSNPVMYSDPSGHSTSLNEVNSVVGIMTILASASTVVIYNIIGDIYGADKTQPSYWIGMVVAVILVAVLTYFTAGAFVEGIAICALGKILIGIMGLITANICCNLSNEARVKGYELYGDIFEFASVLLQTYAFTELLEGIAEGWNSLKEKISNVWQPNKRGAVYIGNENNKSNGNNAELANCNRTEAFNEARDRAGVPRSQQPVQQWTVGGDINKKGYEFSNYRYDSNPTSHGLYYEYDTPKGKVVVVNHTNDVIPHFHAGKPKPYFDPYTYDFKNYRYSNIIIPGKDTHIYYRNN